MGDLVSTLLGGALTIIGGIVATLLLRWLDDRRQDRQERREFRASAILVDDELAANLGMLKAVVNSQSIEVTPHLQSDAYQAHRMTLALGLPPDVRSVVANAYTWAAVPDVQVFAKALEARDETEAARKALKPYIAQRSS